MRMMKLYPFLLRKLLEANDLAWLWVQNVLPGKEKASFERGTKGKFL